LESKKWIEGKTDVILSFDLCCFVLGVNKDYIREKILEKISLANAGKKYQIGGRYVPDFREGKDEPIDIY